MDKTDAFGAMVRRMGYWIGAAGLAGAGGVLYYWGWRDAAGFGIGAVAAYFNMRWLAKALLGETGPTARVQMLRFALLGGAAYVILEIFGIRPLALLAGLLTVAVAAVLEVLFQLIYGSS